MVKAANRPTVPPHYLYALEDSPEAKIEAVARTIYGASDIAYSRTARRDLEQVRRLGYERLPIYIAKMHLQLIGDGDHGRGTQD